MNLRTSCFLAAALCVVAPASAQSAPPAPTPSDARDEARELARRGDDAFGVGRCDKAIPLWRKAEEKFHAPTLLLRIARCQALLGHVVDATSTLSQVVDEKLSAEAGETFVEAQKQATKELAGVRERIAHLRVDVETAAGAPAPRVELDGNAIRTGALLDVDPGSHRLVVRVADTVWERNVNVDEGTSQSVRAAIQIEVPERAPSNQRYIGYALGGAGLVSLAVGGILGLTVMSTSKSLDDACGPDRNACPPDRNDDISSVKTRAVITDLALIGGGALVAAGGVVLLTEPSPKDEPPRFRVVANGLGGRIEGRF